MTYAGPSGSTQSRQPFPVSGVPRPKRETRRCSASRPPRAASASRTGTGRRVWACSWLTRSANPHPNPNPYRNPNPNPNPKPNPSPNPTLIPAGRRRAAHAASAHSRLRHRGAEARGPAA